MPRSPYDDLDGGDALPQSDRLQILSPEEYDALWGRPRFTPADRDIFFSLTPPERDVVKKLHATHTKLHFLLQLGYFRARQRFFHFEISDVHEDVDYLRRRYLEKVPVVDIVVSKITRRRHIDTILKLFRYRLCGHAERAALEAHATRAARISSHPVYVLRELIDHLRQRRIVLPGYTFLQDVVSRALAFERRRVAGMLGELQKRGELAAIQAIKRVSPIAWQHINFYGHYQFDADFSPIDLAAIRQYLSSEEVLRFYAA